MFTMAERNRISNRNRNHVGSPGQTLPHLVEDLLFIEQFHPQMIGIGPFIPHHETPFGMEPAGSVEMTLKLLSLFRLMHPSALIPSTTALATLSPDGREKEYWQELM